VQLRHVVAGPGSACCSWPGLGHDWLLQDHHVLVVHSLQLPYPSVSLVANINSGNEMAICKAEWSQLHGHCNGGCVPVG